MADTVAAILESDLKTKNLRSFLSDHERAGKAVDQLGHKLDLLGSQAATMWNHMGKGSKTVSSDLKAVDRDLGGLGRSLDKLGKHKGFTDLSRDVGGLSTRLDTSLRAVGRLQTALNSLKLPKLSWPSFGGGGGGGGGFGLPSIPGLGLVGGVLGGAAGLAGGVISGGLNLAGAGIGAGFGLAGDIIGKGAALDQKIAYLQAVGGKDFNGADKNRLIDLAFSLPSQKGMGAIGAGDVMDVEAELVKAGIKPGAIAGSTAKAVLQMQAAGGPEMKAADAAKLLVTAKAAFGGEKLTDDQIANYLVGYANATPLGLGDIASQISSGGAAWASSGGKLAGFLTASALEANMGVAKGQIGGGLKQIIGMSDPTSANAMKAMEKLGLVKTETHMEGATAGTTGTKGGDVYIGGKRVGKAKGTRATKGKKGHAVTTIVPGSNKAWDVNGNWDEETLIQAVGEATKGMDAHQVELLISTAFNKKAANYMMPKINAYHQDPETYRKTTKAIKDQGDAEDIASKQTDNLQTSWDKLGKRVDDIKGRIGLMTSGPLKSLVDWGRVLADDVLQGNWGKVRTDFFGMFGDKLGGEMAANWDKNIAPMLNKILDAGKTLATDAATGDWAKFGSDLKADIDGVFGKGTTNTVTSFFGNLKTAWDENAPKAGLLAGKIGTLFFGADADRKAVLADLSKGAGDLVGGFFGDVVASAGAWVAGNKTAVSPAFKMLFDSSLEDALTAFGKEAGKAEDVGGNLARKLRKAMGLDKDLAENPDGSLILDANGNPMHPTDKPQGPYLPSQDPAQNLRPDQLLAKNAALAAAGLATGSVGAVGQALGLMHSSPKWQQRPTYAVGPLQGVRGNGLPVTGTPGFVLPSVGAPAQIIIQTHPGDTNQYTVVPTQRNSRNLQRIVDLRVPKS